MDERMSVRANERTNERRQWQKRYSERRKEEKKARDSRRRSLLCTRTLAILPVSSLFQPLAGPKTDE